VSEPVDPVRRLGRISRLRRSADAKSRADGAEETAREVVPVAPARTHDPEPPKPQGDAVFAAQLLAGPPRRGLKAGRQALVEARATYLGTEYSGSADRRAKKGRETKTEV
jgi:hypothetical protein